MQMSESIQESPFQLLQCIGGDSSYEATEEDLLTVVSYDHTGSHLAVGDNFGRIIIFKRNTPSDSTEDSEKNQTKEPFKFLTELKAHNDDFDVLRSLKIIPSIVALQWVRSPGTSLNLLTASEKNINLCRVTQKRKKRFKVFNGSLATPDTLKMPVPELDEAESWHHTVMRTYPKLHNHTIHSLSVNPNGISFLSADDLSMFLWHIDHGIKAYNLFEFRNSGHEDITEVVTSSQFSRHHESLLLFTTNKGARLLDTRKTTNHHKNTLKFEEPAGGTKNLFTDYLTYVSGASFAEEGKFVTREPLQTKLWDVRITNRPLSVTSLNGGLMHKLAEMFQKDVFMEKFNITCDPTGTMMATGFYNASFHLADIHGSVNYEGQLKPDKSLKMKQILKGQPPPLSKDYAVEKLAVKLDWSPRSNEIAIPYESSIYVYGSPNLS